MAGQIQPHGGNQLQLGGRGLQGLAGLWAASTLSNLFNTNKENLQLVGQSAKKTGRYLSKQYKRARLQYDKYKSDTMPQQSGYKRRKYMPRSKRRAYTKKRSARAVVQRRRVKARKYGNLRSARRLRLPIGGFTQRKVVKLRDNFSFLVTNDNLGQNSCFHFCLSDLKDPQMVGHLNTKVAGGTGPDIPAGSQYYTEPGNYQVYRHQMVPLSTQFADQYKAITVIGAKMTINITNRMRGTVRASAVSTSGSGTDIVRNQIQGLKKVWYAYRVDHYSFDDTPFPSWPVTDHGMKTYQNLKETGKFTMGHITNCGGGKSFSKKIVINYSSRKFWPGPMGLPDGQLAQEFKLVNSNDPGQPAGHQVTVPDKSKYKCVVRLILGPSADYVKSAMQNLTDASANIVDLDEAFCLNNINVDVKTEYHCSLTGLKAISGLDASGIVLPSVPKISWAYTTPHTHT